jgi:hypothetical protein
MAEQPASYSVFLSFNSEDTDFVEKIAVYLADKARLKPWFDRWEMIPGESTIDQLERGLQTCPTCAVFVGSSGKGPWQKKEVEAVLRRQFETKEFRVIPILLPDGPDKLELPSFLGNNVWIDLRQGLADDHALWLLECGILGKPPGRGRPKHAEQPLPEAAECKIAGYVQADVAAAENKVRIFISYRHQETDSALARIFADALRRAGHDVFMDTGIRWGADWIRTIREALAQADYLLLLLSREAAASEMVQEEILLAKELAKERNGLPLILPVRVCLPFAEPLPYPVSTHLDHIQQENWADDWDTPRIVTHLLDITSRQTTWQTTPAEPQPFSRLRSDMPKPQFDPRELVIPGGALEMDSRFYISRDADEEVFFALQRPRALITICGPRQVGKTSLIMRACAGVRHSQEALRVVFVDFQALPDQVFESMDAIWRSIAQHIVDQLMLDEGEFADWKAESGYNRNFTRFLNRVVFEPDATPLLLCLDEVDRVFSAAVRSEFFAAIRAFYNRGAMDRNWKNVRWMLGTSTEPAFFIENMTQSPFNIGYRLELNCFTPAQVDAFARRHGISLTPETLDRIMRYLGGRPYLVHLLLYHWVRKPADREKLFDAQTAGNGVFKDHLHRFLMHFQQEPDMAECMQAIIAGKSCADLKMAARFESAGLVRRDENNRIAPLCDLYAAFFAQTLR